jgi:hypothetical protein
MRVVPQEVGAYAAALKSREAGSLRIAAMPALTGGVLTRFRARFLEWRSNIYASIMGAPSCRGIDVVASGQADLGCADSPAATSGLAVSQIAISAVVVVPQHHRLAGRAVILPEDLARERIIDSSARTPIAR